MWYCYKSCFLKKNKIKIKSLTSHVGGQNDFNQFKQQHLLSIFQPNKPTVVMSTHIVSKSACEYWIRYNHFSELLLKYSLKSLRKRIFF